MIYGADEEVVAKNISFVSHPAEEDIENTGTFAGALIFLRCLSLSDAFNKIETLKTNIDSKNNFLITYVSRY